MSRVDFPAELQRLGERMRMKPVRSGNLCGLIEGLDVEISPAVFDGESVLVLLRIKADGSEFLARWERYVLEGGKF